MGRFRRYLAWLAVVAAAVLATAASAQDYPNKPVRIIIAFSAGGPNDAVMRPLAQRLQEILGQPFVIDYRPGANGVIGTDFVAKSPPDGYTLLAVSSSLPVNAATHAKQPYDLARDFAGVSSVAVSFLVFVVNPTVPVRTVKELVALARARPAMLSYASSGTGGSLHLAVELIALAAGVKMLHIPHKGASPALTDVIAGHVDSMFVAAPVAMPHARNGRVRVLAVGSAERSARLPDVPTFVESGFPKVVVDSRYGLIAPAVTSREAITKLNAAIGKALASAEIRKLYDSQELEAATGTPEAYGDLIREEIAKWRGVVAAAKLQLQ
jgi:tripartite-type tricarboxylate transporter receptor subunit TctC